MICLKISDINRTILYSELFSTHSMIFHSAYSSANMLSILTPHSPQLGLCLAHTFYARVWPVSLYQYTNVDILSLTNLVTFSYHWDIYTFQDNLHIIYFQVLKWISKTFKFSNLCSHNPHSIKSLKHFPEWTFNVSRVLHSNSHLSQTYFLLCLL